MLKKDGVSIVVLIITIIVIIILAAIGISKTMQEVKSAEEVEFKNNMRGIQEKLRIYHQDAILESPQYKPENLQWRNPENPINTGKIEEKISEDKIEFILGNIPSKIEKNIEIIDGEIYLKETSTEEEKKWAKEIEISVVGEDNIDNDITPPVITLDKINAESMVNGASTIRIPIIVRDTESKINLNEFTNSDIIIKIDDVAITPETKELQYMGVTGGNFRYILKLIGITEEGELTLEIPENSIKDKAGNFNIHTVLTPNIIINNSLFTLGSVKINNGELYTKNINVVLTLSAFEVTQMYISNNPNIPMPTASGWKPYLKTVTHTLQPGDGVKTVYVWYKDKNGEITEEITSTIILDTIAPKNIGVTINEGAVYTRTRQVSLELRVTDADYMYISNENIVPKVESSNWIEYLSTVTHTLTDVEENKTVYVWFKDEAGNIAGPASATIIYRIAAVISGTVNINDGAEYTSSTNVILTLDSTGSTKMYISNVNIAPEISNPSWINYNITYQHTLTSGDGQKTVYVWFKDANNNISDEAIDTIILDTVAPIFETVQQGKMLQKDPAFKIGKNSISVYNNEGNGTVSNERIEAPLGTPNSSGYIIKVMTKGTARPSWGGFVQHTTSRSGATFVHRIIAKIPVGRTITRISNSCGTEVVHTWQTPTAGTGDWEEYVYTTACGYTGTFSTLGFVYLLGGATPTESNPLIWDVAYSTIYDTTPGATTEFSARAIDIDSGIVAYGINQSSTVEPTYTNVSNTKYLEISSNTITENGTYYIWVKDVAGNIGKQEIVVNLIDKTVPIINITPSVVAPEEAELITLTAVASDNFKIKSIESPDGTILYNVTSQASLTVTYNITKNGTYTFKATDYAGNIKIESIVVTNISTFVTEWTIPTANTTIKLPIHTTAPDIVIDWGDGSPLEVVTTLFPTHTYAYAGAYDIKITGTCRYFGYNTDAAPLVESDYYTFTQYITKIKSWGALGVYRVGFAQCTGLSGTIPNPTQKSFESATSFYYTFYNCTLLTGSIPVNFFANCPNVASMGSVFNSCSGLTGSIPANLFANCQNITTFNLAFYGCSDLTGSIPESLFINCSKATTFHGTFYNCSGLTGSISANLFVNCPNVTVFYALFYGCSGLTGNISANLFTNCPKVTDFRYTFYNCSGLTGSIPANLFANCPEVTTFSYTFYGCSGLTGGIPANLFANCTDVTGFSSTFYNCSGLTGSIPTNLFANNLNVTSFSSTFYNCNNLTGEIPANLFAKYPNVTTFYCAFYGCSGLTGSIPENLFTNKSEVTTFQSTFYNCSGLTGSIPAGLFASCTNVVNFSSTFRGCSNLTGIMSLDLFASCTEVTSFSTTFYGCSNLTGFAPDLWNRTTDGLNGTSCFQGCHSLYNFPVIPAAWRGSISDSTLPTLTITSNIVPPTEAEVITLTATAQDSNRIHSLVNPDGTIVYVTSDTKKIISTYNVTKNGTYTFKAIDIVGNETTQSYTVTNITEFITEWTIPTASTAIKLPIHTTAPNIVVDWGDGSPLEVVTTLFPTHTYAYAGAYDIKITGTCRYFGYNTDAAPLVESDYYTFTQYITKIKSWGALGVYRVGFAQCTGLSGTIPNPTQKSFESATSFYYTFYNCTLLTGSIPANLFANCSKVTDFSNTFSDCSGLTGSIPENLFANCPNVTTFFYTFYNCSGLTGNAPDLWNRTTGGLNGASCFTNCVNLSNRTAIPVYWGGIEGYIGGQWNNSKGVNTPKLVDGMTVIKWDGSTETIVANPDTDTSWYDYSSQEWANAKTADGSYWVWIPRYAYKITSGHHGTGLSVGQAGNIDIIFLEGTTNTRGGTTYSNTYPSVSGGAMQGYVVHPAFGTNLTLGGWSEDIPGIWVAKFEASRSNATSGSGGSGTTVKIQPNVKSWINITAANAYTYSYNMNRVAESHLIKNSEWGSVAYLSKSIYGKAAIETTINSNASLVTGGGNYIANVAQSTTGNITGVYDMNGGSFEYTAMYVKNGNANLSNNGASFTSTTSPQNTRYATTYSPGGTGGLDTSQNNYGMTSTMYGDAIYETSPNGSNISPNSWFSDFNLFPYGQYAFMVRGGEVSNGSGLCGVFGYDFHDGSMHDYGGFRVTLIP